MDEVKQTGLRQRKKAQMRQQIADTAARLFAAQGYEQVSIADVARAVEVSDQTVYNYFPAKEDLVLDRAEAIRRRYLQIVSDRPSGTSPAAALRAVAREDIERHRHTDPAEARGEFSALCISSPHIRRFALAVRDQQVETVAAAITATCPAIHPAIVRAHASALISVFQMITDHLGRSVLAGTPPLDAIDELTPAVEAVMGDLDRHFHTLVRLAGHDPPAGIEPLRNTDTPDESRSSSRKE